MVVALGPQSGLIFKKFGYSIPLGIKRGHHMHFEMQDDVRLGHTVVDEEAGYVLAPVVHGVRLSTGIEFASPDAPANFIQLKRAEKVARRLLPQLGTPVESSRGSVCARACRICGRLLDSHRAIRDYGLTLAMLIMG